MTVKQVASTAMRAVRTGLISAADVPVRNRQFASCRPKPQPTHATTTPATPIKHVIVIIGENRSFDHVFATYVPKKGETVWNLLSEGIIKADGTPGPNFSKAEQSAAYDEAPDAFLLSPAKTTFPGRRASRSAGRWTDRTPMSRTTA